jgi:hypothetical protein
MYTPAYHAFNDIEKMHAHVAEHPLGAWVCNRVVVASDNGSPMQVPLPLMYRAWVSMCSISFRR